MLLLTPLAFSSQCSKCSVFVPETSIFTVPDRKLFWCLDYRYTCPFCVEPGTPSQPGVRGRLDGPKKPTKWADVCRIVLIDLILSEAPQSPQDDSLTPSLANDPGRASDGSRPARTFFSRREIETIIEKVRACEGEETRN